MGNYSWVNLFTPSDQPNSLTVTQRFRVLRKQGEPLLILPTRHALAAQALSLYPAQSWLARMARFGLRQTMLWGLPVGTESAEVTIASTDNFPQFLRRLAGTETFPPLAILAGNPRQSGRRFLLLVFNAQGRPASVVKAGMGEAADDLIRLEGSFLKSVPSGTPGIPKLREQFESDSLSAFAMDFIAGDSPRRRDDSEVAGLMTAWLDQSRTVGLSDLASWRRLAGAPSPLFARLDKQLGGKQFHPCLSHGDFAPWNIKVGSDGRWVVLDWERGQLTGPPAWDWFHFVIQPAILVEKLSTTMLAGKFDGLLISTSFQRYAKAAGLAGFEREWVLAYLLYCRDIIKPAEGLPQTSALLETLASKWLAN
ncbi:MAG: hypothetical protein QOJ40_1541 [Verrucomicrobiota bacterium]